MDGTVQQQLVARLEKHVRANWENYIEDIRIDFKGNNAYIEVILGDAWVPDLSKIQFSEPVQLDRFELICILTYTGDMESWEYQTTPVDHISSTETLITGTGKPEECFDRAANLRVP